MVCAHLHLVSAARGPPVTAAPRAATDPKLLGEPHGNFIDLGKHNNIIFLGLGLVPFVIVICAYIYLYCFSTTPTNIEDIGGEGIELNEVRVSRVQMDSFPTSTFPNERVVGSGCRICLEDYGRGDVLVSLPMCSHTFHHRCTEDWFRYGTRCPLCRHDYAT